MRPVGFSHVENQEGKHWDDGSGQETEKWMRDPSLQPSASEPTAVRCFPPSLILSFPPPFSGYLFSVSGWVFSPSTPFLRGVLTR